MNANKETRWRKRSFLFVFYLFIWSFSFWWISENFVVFFFVIFICESFVIIYIGRNVHIYKWIVLDVFEFLFYSICFSFYRNTLNFKSNNEKKRTDFRFVWHFHSFIFLFPFILFFLQFVADKQHGIDSPNTWRKY